MAPSADRSQHWQPGDPLTEDDRALLAPLQSRARELGRTPVRREVQNAEAVKRRFRTWGNAVRAAGLPWVNYPQQRRLAEQQRHCSKAAPDHPHHSQSSHCGSPAADHVLRHARGARDHAADADHEGPAE